MDSNKVNERITDVTSALITTIIDLEIKTRILTEVFTDRGIITREELEEKYKLIQDRDFDKISSDINDLINRFETKKV